VHSTVAAGAIEWIREILVYRQAGRDPRAARGNRESEPLVAGGNRWLQPRVARARRTQENPGDPGGAKVGFDLAQRVHTMRSPRFSPLTRVLRSARLVRDARGNAMVEYAIVTGGVTLAGCVGLAVVGLAIVESFQFVRDLLLSPVP
jgi:Flp pilus assembly pilin Flp